MGHFCEFVEWKKHEGSIPFTCSIDFQGFSQQCSKSAVNAGGKPRLRVRRSPGPLRTDPEVFIWRLRKSSTAHIAAHDHYTIVEFTITQSLNRFFAESPKCVMVTKVGHVALAMSVQTAKYPAQRISDGREKICFLEALCPEKVTCPHLNTPQVHRTCSGPAEDPFLRGTPWQRRCKT
jgi:hypothetical protein